MHKIKKQIEKLFRLSVLAILGVSILFMPFFDAQAQVPGTNGRIIWAGNNRNYTMLPSGLDISDTGIPVNVGSVAAWQAMYSADSSHYVTFLSSNPGASNALNTAGTSNQFDASPVFLQNNSDIAVTVPSPKPDGTAFAYIANKAGVYTARTHAVTPGAPGSPPSFVNTPSVIIYKDAGTGSVPVGQPVWDNQNSSRMYLKRGSGSGSTIIRISSTTADQTVPAVTMSQASVKGIKKLSDIHPYSGVLLFTKADVNGDEQLYTVPKDDTVTAAGNYI